MSRRRLHTHTRRTARRKHISPANLIEIRATLVERNSAKFSRSNILPARRRRKRDTWRCIWDTNDDGVIYNRASRFHRRTLCTRAMSFSRTVTRRGQNELCKITRPRSTASQCDGHANANRSLRLSFISPESVRPMAA